jgi:integrase
MRPKNAVPAYVLHQTSGQARTRIANKDYYLGPFNSPESKTAYANLLAQFAVGGELTVTRSPEIRRDVSVAEGMLRFLKFGDSWPRAEDGINEELRHYKALFRIVTDKFAHLLLNDVRGPHVKALQSAAVDRGWGRKYVNSQIRRFRRFVRWCLSEDLCDEGVVTRVAAVEGLRAGRTSAPDFAPVKPVPDDVFLATLPHVPPTIADLLRVMAFCGCRAGELRLLRIGDINRDSTVWSAKLSAHKTAYAGKRRTLFFGAKSQEVLRPYLTADRDPTEYVFSPRRSEQLRLEKMRAERIARARRRGLSGRIQPSQQCRALKDRIGKLSPHYKKSALTRAVTRGCEVLFNMPTHLRVVSRKLTAEEREKLLAAARAWRAENVWSPHQIRHSAATKLREAYGIEIASQVLGHSSLPVAEIYAEKNEKEVRRIIGEVG